MDFKNKIFEKLIGVKAVVLYFDFDQENKTMSDLDYDSCSAVVNNLNLFTSILLVIILHLIIYAIIKMMNKCFKINMNTRLMKIFNNIHEKFILGAYIRILLESFQGIIMTTVSEINQFNNQSDSRITSLSLCILILLIAIIE